MAFQNARRPPGASAAAGVGGSQTQAAAAETATDRRVPEAARAAVAPAWDPAARAHQGESRGFATLQLHSATEQTRDTETALNSNAAHEGQTKVSARAFHRE